MKWRIIIVFFLVILSKPGLLFSVEIAPRISDKEIIERLTRLEEGQKNIEKHFDNVNSRFDDVSGRFDDVNKRFEDVNKRFDDVNRRIDDLRSEMNGRFDTLQWMFGIFISIAIILFGFILRMQWQRQKRQAIMETTLDAQKEELAFIKELIEKFTPPRGAL